MALVAGPNGDMDSEYRGWGWAEVWFLVHMKKEKATAKSASTANYFTSPKPRLC